MKKRIAVQILIYLLIAGSLFSFTDSFSDNRDNESYNLLISAVKNDAEPGEVASLYTLYTQAETDPVDLCRMEYSMVRYYMDRGMKDEAVKHYELCEKHFNAIEESGVRKDIAEIEKISAHYYIHKDMGSGMDSSSLTKKLYKAYPDEINAILLEANRLLYSPHIAGGSPKRGLKLFETLLPEEANLQTIDRFALFAGLGCASEKRNKDEDARRYLETAISIYSGDKLLQETLDSLK